MRYVYDRLSQMAYQRRHPRAPWIAADMVDILEQLLRPDDRGVEWGTGRSTVWLAHRVGHIDAVEENPAWYETVGEMLRDDDLTSKVALRLEPATGDRTASAPYVRCVSGLGPECLDFAVVDGDLRDHCAALAIELLKPGGLLVIDNVERYIPRRQPTRSPASRRLEEGFASGVWEQVGRELASWRSIWKSDGVSDTGLWIKPLRNV